MHPIEKLASAIATMEGYFAKGSDLPKKNFNPGDLRASPLPRKKDAHGFVVFNSEAEGVAALIVQLMLYTLRGLTLQQVIELYAPPTGLDGGNNTKLYLSETVRRTGISADTKLNTLFHIEMIP